VKSKDKKNEKIDQNGDDKKVGLYGVWQTVPYSPPQASNVHFLFNFSLFKKNLNFNILI